MRRSEIVHRLRMLMRVVNKLTVEGNRQLHWRRLRQAFGPQNRIVVKR